MSFGRTLKHCLLRAFLAKGLSACVWIDNFRELCITSVLRFLNGAFGAGENSVWYRSGTHAQESLLRKAIFREICRQCMRMLCTFFVNLWLQESTFSLNERYSHSKFSRSRLRCSRTLRYIVSWGMQKHAFQSILTILPTLNTLARKCIKEGYAELF